MKLTTPYEQFVQSIVKPGHDILVQLTPLQASILHMAVGVSGEAGELLDAIKKHAVYQKQLDFDNVREEAGDILFYLTGLLNELGLTINAAAIARVDKLDVIEEQAVLKDDDDLADIKVERTCRIDDPECESCQ